MWKYIGDELGLEGIIGVPNRDMTDREFKEASGKLARKHQGQPLDSLAKSGLWVYEADASSRRTSTRRSIDLSAESPAITTTEEEASE